MTGFQVAPTSPGARAAGPALALIIVALGAMGVALLLALDDHGCSYSGTDPAAAKCIDERHVYNQAATTIAIIGVGLMVGGCALNVRAGTLAGQQSVPHGPAFAGPYPQPPFPQMQQPQYGPPQPQYGQPPAPGAQFPAGVPGQQSGPQPQAQPQPQPPTGPQH